MDHLSRESPATAGPEGALQGRPDVAPPPRSPDAPADPPLPSADLRPVAGPVARPTGPAGLLGVPPAADLAPGTLSWRPVVLCFALTLLLYLPGIWQILRYVNPPTGDQPLYLMDVISLAQDGDLNVANNYAARDEDKFYRLAPHPPGFQQGGAPYPLPPQLANSTARPAAEQYSFHPPGIAVLLLPAWIVGGWFALWWPATIVAMCVIGALVATNIFLLADEVTGRRRIAWAVWAPLAFSIPLIAYTYLIFTELPVGLFIIYAFRRLALGWRANGPGRLLLLGVGIGFIPWLAWRCLPLAAALGLYAVVQWWRQARAIRQEGADGGAAGPPRRWAVPRGTAWFIVPLGLLGVLWVSYNLFLFSSPLPDVRFLGGVSAGGFNLPWAGPAALALFINGAFAILFDLQWGLLTYAPVYLLAVVGIVAMVRLGRPADRRLLFWMALVALPYTAIIAAFEYWNGLWCPPARYLTSLVPLLAAPLAMALFALARSLVYKGLYIGLTLIGWGFAAFWLYQPINFFPLDQGYFFNWLAGAPELPFHLNLRRMIPAYAWPDPARQPLLTGWVLVAAALIVLGCSVLMARHDPVRRLPRRPLAVQGLLWLGALGILGAGWLTINREHLEHKTVLTQQQRWEIGVPLTQPLGLAYLDNTIFVADYRGALGALDLASGRYATFQPWAALEMLTYTHPGAVKVGPDGLLYLLNNGDGPNALYVMRPTGEVVRRLPLDMKGPIATGVSFGPGGTLYIADMSNAQIIKYDLARGVALQLLRAEFDNLSSVVVADDGTVYGIDLTRGRVQHIGREGQVVRSYPIGCHAWDAVLHGDWLDLTCDKGFVSINRRTHIIQQARVNENDPPLVYPTGLLYGPDETLYIIDGNKLTAYKVEH